MNFRLFLPRAILVISGAMLLPSCVRSNHDLPAFAPATKVVVTEYGTPRPHKAGPVTTWTLTDAKKVAHLAGMADAEGKNWRDMGVPNMTTETGIKLKFTGPNLDQTFTVYAQGFEDSYGTSKGNLWFSSDSGGGAMQTKLLGEEEIDKLASDVLAVVKDVKPDATPRPTAATPKASTVKPVVKGN